MSIDSISQISKSKSRSGSMSEYPPPDMKEVMEVVIVKIRELFDLYSNNHYMLSRIHGIVHNQFPQMLAGIDANYNIRKHRIDDLVIKQNIFIQSFIATNRYFMCERTEKFFFYDGERYMVYSEDDIIHLIMTAITKDQSSLITWKRRTCINVMQRIKHNKILDSIPESSTIQRVLDSLYPVFFSSKISAKYFLTIVGDNIHKKNPHLIHFIHPTAKKFLQELNNICIFVFGVNIYGSFKYKYHEHEYTNCRLIQVNNCIQLDKVYFPILSRHGLDILCVASHYSHRYGNSDTMIDNQCSDHILSRSIYYLKDNTKDDIVDMFISVYLQFPISSVSSNDSIPKTTFITWKNMQYLWKLFLSSQNLPAIMFQQTLKECLCKKLSIRVSEPDIFYGVFSEYLPIVHKFMQFWEDNIIIDDTESDFEIEELSQLFRRWCRNSSVHSLTDYTIIDLILYYHPEVEIYQEKYIQKIRCILWDKQLDIHIAMGAMKAEIDDTINSSILSNYEDNSDICNISIYDAYTYYCNHYTLESVDDTRPPSSKISAQIVNKIYFEKIIIENIKTFYWIYIQPPH
jgi:hypothetical protein